MQWASATVADRDGIGGLRSGRNNRFISNGRRALRVESRGHRRNSSRKKSTERRDPSTRQRTATVLKLTDEQTSMVRGIISAGMNTDEEIDVDLLQSTEESDTDIGLSLFDQTEERMGSMEADFQEITKSFPFELDKFQTMAIRELLSGKSVVICAPTGAGKTAIADAAASACLSRGKKVIYTTPLKALSNQKLHEFRKRFGHDNCGLITGDTNIRFNAPVIIMTTEILRNMFYDVTMEQMILTDRLDEIGLVVLDEVHYLGSPDRGSVWEELIVGCPKHIQMLCMSATVSNPQDLGDWIAHIHGPCSTIKTNRRPVPLSWHFIFRKAESKEAEIAPLLNDQHTGVNPVCIYKTAVGFGEEATEPVKPGTRVPPMDSVIHTLKEKDMLPAIFFIFSRGDCDRHAVRMQKLNISLTTEEESEKIQRAIDAIKSVQPEAIKKKCIRALVNGIATHHAGCLPAWKFLVESLFQEGLLKVVFATGTLAAGINMPARTTVITGLARMQDGSMSLISHNELLQMAGRAGRRGYDTSGNCVMMQNRYEGASEGMAILMKGSEPLTSQFTTGYSFVLNLLAKFTIEEAKSFLDKSFKNYMTGIGLIRKAKEIDELRETVKALRSMAEAERNSREAAETDGSHLKEEYREASTVLRSTLSVARQERRDIAQNQLEQQKFPFPVLIDITKNALGFNVLPAIALGMHLKTEDNKKTGDKLVCLGSDNVFYRVSSRAVVGILNDSQLEVDIFSDVMLEAASPKRQWKSSTAAAVEESMGNSETAKFAFKTPNIQNFQRISWSRATQLNIDALSARNRQLKKAMRKADDGSSQLSSALRKLRSAEKRLMTALRLKNELRVEKEQGWNGFMSIVKILTKVGALEEGTLAIKPLGHVTRELFGVNELWMAMVFTHERIQMLKPSHLAALASTFVAPNVCQRPSVSITVPPPPEIEELLKAIDESRSALFQYEVTTLAFNRQSLAGLEMDPRAAGLVEAWVDGCQWTDLIAATNLDDGDLARLLANTQDILRQIQLSHHLLEPLRESARNAFRDMDRNPIRTQIV